MIDPFLSRRYSASNYNCAHFVIEVWQHMTGQNLDELLHGFLCAPSRRAVDLSEARKVRFIDKPDSPCLVLMQRRAFAHVGIWYKKRVLHLIDNRGVQYMPLEIASLGFTKTRFFLCK